MNFTDMFNAFRNPQAFVIQKMMQENPQIMQQCQTLLNGKSRNEQIETLRSLYKSKGLDFDTIARQYGVQI